MIHYRYYNSIKMGMGDGELDSNAGEYGMTLARYFMIG
jgi:hypothetical protein